MKTFIIICSLLVALFMVAGSAVASNDGTQDEAEKIVKVKELKHDFWVVLRKKSAKEEVRVEIIDEQGKKVRFGSIEGGEMLIDFGPADYGSYTILIIGEERTQTHVYIKTLKVLNPAMEHNL